MGPATPTVERWRSLWPPTKPGRFTTNGAEASVRATAPYRTRACSRLVGPTSRTTRRMSHDRCDGADQDPMFVVQCSWAAAPKPRRNTLSLRRFACAVRAAHHPRDGARAAALGRHPAIYCLGNSTEEDPTMTVTSRCANCEAPLPPDQPADNQYCAKCTAAWQRGRASRD
jgi:hypothetical protein